MNCNYQQRIYFIYFQPPRRQASGLHESSIVWGEPWALPEVKLLPTYFKYLFLG